MDDPGVASMGMPAAPSAINGTRDVLFDLDAVHAGFAELKT